MRKILSLVTALLLLFGDAWSQTRSVSGTVTDEQGNPVPNASIIIKGTSTGTTSKADGTFTLGIPSGPVVLVFSSVGMADQELSVGSSSTYAVVLKGAANSMQEVVVVAYGTQQKTNITGSIATVKAETVEGRPFTSVDKTLQGNVAGLLSTSQSGAPGSASGIRIRGTGSINASQAPLWVIDGVIATTGDLTNNTTTANALATLNPDDIESITVLKDASAASIYGSRAANGVILVTTKKGKSGKSRLNFTAETGQNSIAYKNDKYRPMTTDEYRQVLNESLINAGFAADEAEADAITLDPVNGFGLKPDVNTDWRDVVTQNGTQSNYSLNISGGNERTSFYASAGIFNQEGTTIATDFKRYNGALSLMHRATDKITLSTSINLGTSRQRTPTNGGTFANPILASHFLLPWYSPYNEDGSFKWDDDEFQFPANGGIFNPVIQAAWNKNQAVQTTLRGHVTGEYKILKNLKFTSRYSAEYFNVQEDSYRNPFYGDGQAAGGDGFAVYRKIFNYTWANFADYRLNVNAEQDMYFDIKAGFEAQEYDDYVLQAGAQGFPENLNLQYLASAATPNTASSAPSDYSTNSIFSNVAFNYKDRYVVTGSFRRDGSSVFGSNKRWGNFYSVGATWNITEEAFMQTVDVLSLLKLRGSYGENGNALGFGFYAALPTYGYGANYTGLPGSVLNNVGFEDLTWEKNKVLNIGLDFGLFNNRLGGTVEVYDRQTSGMLFSVVASPTAGVPNILQNIGTISNKGVEVSLSGRPVQTKDFTWEVRFNIAHNKNRVKELYRDAPIGINGFQRVEEGYDVNTFYLREWVGVDPDNGKPQWYRNADKEEIVNSYAQSSLIMQKGKSSSPKFFGGFGSTLSYKGVSVDFLFAYNFGNYVYSIWDRYMNSEGIYLGSFNQSSSQLQSWKKPGDVTDVPQVIYGGNGNSWNHSSRYLYKGDFIRLRDIQVAYVLPTSVAQRLRLGSLSLYVRGSNLVTFATDDRLPLDPEAGPTAQNNFDVFIPRTITGGIKIGL
jgi:TonB-linked SusC/RagA family outer membrane protein